MKRLAEKQLLEWKDSSRRKPLIIRGARQVGKTWLVENFLAKQFDSYVKIDLENVAIFTKVSKVTSIPKPSLLT